MRGSFQSTLSIPYQMGHTVANYSPKRTQQLDFRVAGPFSSRRLTFALLYLLVPPKPSQSLFDLIPQHQI
jgi:hypothetical protein